MDKAFNLIKNKIVILSVLTAVLIVLSFFIDVPYLFALLTLIVAFDAKSVFTKMFLCIKQIKFNSDLLRGLAILILYFYSLTLTLFQNASPDVSRPIVFIGLPLILIILEILKHSKGKVKFESILDGLKEHEKDYKIGGIIEVKSGEIIPADGIIIEGETLVNEHSITGNDSMIQKKFNDEVIGTTINMKNRILIKVTQSGDDRVVNQIKTLVNDQGNEQSNLEQLFKKLQNILGLLFLLMALSLFVVWFKLTGSFFISIFTMCSILLIVAPENFYNSIKLPFKIGIKQTTKKGIFIKNNKIIEKLNKITRIIFKKRNVLTEGKLKVTNIIPKEAFDIKRFLILIGSLESLAASPIAQTITEYCENQKISFKKVRDYKVIKGMGIIGIIDNQEFIIGNERLMQQYKVKMTEDLFNKAEVMSRSTRTPIFISRDRALIGVIGISDVLKDNLKVGIKNLKKDYKVTLITGDNKTVAKGLCDEIGINEFVAELDEIEKLETLKKYREDNDIVLAVGDGKEDKDFLDESDVGISFGAYTDLLEKSNDVTIITDNIIKIDSVLKIAKKIKFVSKKNLQITTLYHFIGLLLASGLFIPILNLLMIPAGAAVLMLSSYILIEKNSFSLLQDKSDPRLHPSK